MGRKTESTEKKVGWNGQLLITVDGLSEKPEIKKAQNEMIAELMQNEVAVENASAEKKLKEFCIH